MKPGRTMAQPHDSSRGYVNEICESKCLKPAVPEALIIEDNTAHDPRTRRQSSLWDTGLGATPDCEITAASRTESSRVNPATGLLANTYTFKPHIWKSENRAAPV